MACVVSVNIAACSDRAAVGDEDAVDASNQDDPTDTDDETRDESTPGSGDGGTGNADDDATGTDILGEDDTSEPNPLPGIGDGGLIDPCEVIGCGPGQRCSSGDGGAQCVDLSCDELECEATERCAEAELGGHVCVDASCAKDVDCAANEYCGADDLCVADVCSAGARSCDGNAVTECTSSGDEARTPYTCSTLAHFDSACFSPSPDDAACSCEDDWDCPAFTVCEVDQCRGTGVEPTCTLPPTSFLDTKPAVESHWGGDAADDDLAHDGSAEQSPAPWPDSAHVWTTPIVANLDDDNGDGLINELDFPEIVFNSYTRGLGDDSGVVRAIHGGGPSRGKDYFARCGELLWTESAPTDEACDGGDARAAVPVAIADLDGDQVPEIVTVTHAFGFRILNNKGELLIDRGDERAYADQAPELGYPNDHFASPSIANLDYEGLPELIFGGTVYTFDLDDEGKLFISYRLDGIGTQGLNEYTGAVSCAADLHSRAGQELLAGTTLYALPADLPECDAPPCSGTLDVVWSAAEVNGVDPEPTDAGAPAPRPLWDGFCAVADVWGANRETAPGPDNPPDGQPEAILIADGTLLILDAETGEQIERRDLGGGARGGAPNVDDFDGDGFMEIASALQNFYVVVDLQEPTADSGNCPAWPTSMPRIPEADQADNPNLAANKVRDPGGEGAMSLPSGAVVPGSCTTDADCAANSVCNEQARVCVCLHNGWQRTSDDSSSRATSSSVFDFNGDGAAEVLYNDECHFRVYDGVNGTVLYSEISRSRTMTENPVVADVDNDGNAEVVTVMNTEATERCDDDTGGQGAGPNGIRVWGDPADTWVSARRIWNQQSYHVTNITEAGLVPAHAAESWGNFDGRTYNTFRSQPRSFGVAPDLQVTAISVFSPELGCGQLGSEIDIVFEVANNGDVRVGPGVQVAFYGTWGDEEQRLQGPDGALGLTLETNIEPGRSVIQSVSFDLADQEGQDELPDSVRVVVDSAGDEDFGSERECNEDNNDLSQAVEAGSVRPDLGIALGEATVDCGKRIATVSVTVSNDGTADAEGVSIQIFAGDPARGGTLLAEVELDEPLPAGEETTLEVEIPKFPSNRSITLWGWVDPDARIDECNEGNNTDPAENAIECRVRGQVR